MYTKQNVLNFYSPIAGYTYRTFIPTMADTATAPAPAAAAPVAPKSPKKKSSKPKTPASHPKYIDMVQAAISNLKERGGSSRQAILKYIAANYKVGNNQALVNSRLKVALKGGVKAGALKQSKGTGASGSFRLGAKPEKKVVKKKAVKKPKAKKPKAAAKKPKAKSPKKKKVVKKAAGEKKAVKPKKAKTPKKAKAPKPKKAKSPKKAKTAKPKKAKTPKKKAAAKQ